MERSQIRELKKKYPNIAASYDGVVGWSCQEHSDDHHLLSSLKDVLQKCLNSFPQEEAEESTQPTFLEVAQLTENANHSDMEVTDTEASQVVDKIISTDSPTSSLPRFEVIPFDPNLQVATPNESDLERELFDLSPKDNDLPSEPVQLEVSHDSAVPGEIPETERRSIEDECNEALNKADQRLSIKPEETDDGYTGDPEVDALILKMKCQTDSHGSDCQQLFPKDVDSDPTLNEDAVLQRAMDEVQLEKRLNNSTSVPLTQFDFSEPLSTNSTSETPAGKEPDSSESAIDTLNLLAVNEPPETIAIKPTINNNAVYDDDFDDFDNEEEMADWLDVIPCNPPSTLPASHAISPTPPKTTSPINGNSPQPYSSVSHTQKTSSRPNTPQKSELISLPAIVLEPKGSGPNIVAAIRSNKERLAMANRQIALKASQYSEQSLREEIAEIRYTLIKVCSADNERAAKRDAELNRHAMMAEQAEPPRVGKVKSLIFQMRKNYGDVSGLECGPLWPAVNRTQMTGFVKQQNEENPQNLSNHLIDLMCSRSHLPGWLLMSFRQQLISVYPLGEVPEKALGEIMNLIYAFVDHLAIVIGRAFTCNDSLFLTIERCVFAGIFDHIYALVATVHATHQSRWTKSIQFMYRLQQKDLDVAERFQEINFQTKGVDVLRKITKVTAPHDMLQTITDTLKSLSTSASELCPNAAIGADDLIPLAAYSIAQAEIPNIPTLRVFIETFMRPDTYLCEAGYSLCTLESCLEVLIQEVNLKFAVN